VTIAHTITISEPTVCGSTVRFCWQVEPATALYRDTSFELTFPESVPIDRVPMAVWWRVAIVCLHPHWALLRPCRVVVPVSLDPGEREMWLRLCDAQVATLESLAQGSDTGRTIDLVEGGPPLAPLEPAADAGPVVACFSGGRDSLTQAALLQELGERPLLVTTTSPREGSVEHNTERRRHVLDGVQRRRNLELVEVRSDLRSCWDNGFVAARYGIGVNEVTDTFLYFAAALAVAVAHGARAVYLASETEVQESARRAGAIVQHKHFMYAAATQRALSALFSPAGVHYGGLMYPLYQFQVQRLLERRYADLRDLQYSCWLLAADRSACSRCDECRTIAFNMMVEGVAPREIGIDLVALLDSQSGWRARTEEIGAALPNARWLFDSQMVRCLQSLTPERVVGFIELDGPGSEAAAASLVAYERMRAAALTLEVDPEPGYRAGFLELVAEPLRGPLAAIFDEHFTPEPIANHAGVVHRSMTLSDWISAPLLRTELGRRRRAPISRRAINVPRRPVRVRPPAPVRLTEAELAPIRALIPGPEPVLAERSGGEVLRVAQALLDGNELRYVSECVKTGWVSSAGSFVGRFEAAMAQAAGCRHGIACSSGTTALHLALAAAGVGPGDEVIVPTFTMIASANAIGYVGATAVLVDSDPKTWNVDIDRIADSIGPSTRAIMIMHTYGHPVDADAVAELARRNDLVVIEDAAEAHGAEYHGRRAGSLGTVAGFSFYGNKILTTGEGGMVTTDDGQIAAVARELRDHAFSAERHFWHRFRGFNFRMSNLQAAVGLAQAERMDDLLAARRRAADRYRAALAAVPGLELAPQQPGYESAEWMFGILIGDDFGCSRDELREHLAADGIETRTFFVPIHLQPAYHADYGGRRYPVAERLGRCGLYLPSGPHVTEADIAAVSDSIRGAATRDRREAGSPR
jgi:perosamine synthetase